MTKNLTLKNLKECQNLYTIFPYPWRRIIAEIERLNGGIMDISSNHMFQHETHDNNVEIKNELENLE